MIVSMSPAVRRVRAGKDEFLRQIDTLVFAAGNAGR